MSCAKCEEYEFPITFVRWGNANIGLVGCENHVGEIIIALKRYVQMESNNKAMGEENAKSEGGKD